MPSGSRLTCEIMRLRRRSACVFSSPCGMLVVDPNKFYLVALLFEVLSDRRELRAVNVGHNGSSNGRDGDLFFTCTPAHASAKEIERHEHHRVVLLMSWYLGSRAPSESPGAGPSRGPEVRGPLVLFRGLLHLAHRLGVPRTAFVSRGSAAPPPFSSARREAPISSACFFFSSASCFSASFFFSSSSFTRSRIVCDLLLRLVAQ